jgi:hypothetical protein
MTSISTALDVEPPKLVSDNQIECLIRDITCCIDKPGLTEQVNIPGIGALVKMYIRTLERGFTSNLMPLNAIISVLKDVASASNPPVAFLDKIKNVSEGVIEVGFDPVKAIVEELQSPAIENLPIPFLTTEALICFIKGEKTLREIFQASTQLLKQAVEKINAGESIDDVEVFLENNASPVLFGKKMKELDALELQQVLTLLIPKDQKLIPAEQIPFVEDPPEVCLPPIIKFLELILLPIKIPVQLFKWLIKKIEDVVKVFPKIASLVAEFISDPIGYIKDQLVDILTQIFCAVINALSPIPFPSEFNVKNFIKCIVNDILNLKPLASIKQRIQSLIKQIPALGAVLGILEAFFSFIHCLFTNLFSTIFSVSEIPLLFLKGLGLVDDGNSSTQSEQGSSDLTPAEAKEKQKKEASNVLPNPVFGRLYKNEVGEDILETKPGSKFTKEMINQKFESGDAITLKALKGSDIYPNQPKNEIANTQIKRITTIKRNVSNYVNFGEEDVEENPAQIIRLVISNIRPDAFAGFRDGYVLSSDDVGIQVIAQDEASKSTESEESESNNTNTSSSNTSSDTISVNTNDRSENENEENSNEQDENAGFDDSESRLERRNRNRRERGSRSGGLGGP